MITDKLKNRTIIENNIDNDYSHSIPDIPSGKWIKCLGCNEILYKEILNKNYGVCPICNYYFRLTAKERVNQIADEGTFEEFENVYIKSTKDKIENKSNNTDNENFKINNPINETNMISNPLGINGYDEKVEDLRKKNGIDEAVITGKCSINGENAILCVMDSYFFLGSMGSVVGEKITRAIEKATELKLPIIIFSASGGARMQEGIISLMQMAKTSSAIAKASEEGILYISVLTDPTYGGVTASFATLGDIILAEPKAMIGFAGPRVIKQTLNQELPDGFQTSEFLLEHGFIDKIVERSKLKDTLYKLIKLHM